MKILTFNEGHNVAGPGIKRLRKQRGLTQEQVAAQMQVEGIQVDQKAISRIESGDRVITDYEIMMLARILGTSVDQLIKESMYDAQKDGMD